MKAKVWLSFFRQTLLVSLLLVFGFYSQVKANQCSINFAPGSMKTKEITDVLDMASNLRRGLESHLQKYSQQGSSQEHLLHREPLSISIFFLGMTSVTVRRVDPDTSSSGETIPEVSIKNSTLGNILRVLKISEKDFQNYLLGGQSSIRALTEMKPADRRQENDPLTFEVNRKNESEGSWTEQMRALETQAISALNTDARNGNTNALHLSIEHLLLGAMTFSNPVRDFFVQTLKPTINWGIFQRWRNWRDPNNQVKFERETEFLQGRIQWAINQVRINPQGEHIWPTSADAPRSYMQGRGYEPILRPSSEDSPSIPYARNLTREYQETVARGESQGFDYAPPELLRDIFNIFIHGQNEFRNVVLVSAREGDLLHPSKVVDRLIFKIEHARSDSNSPYHREIPRELLDKDILFLEIENNGQILFAGKSYVGQSEQSVKDLMDAIRKEINERDGHVVLVVRNLWEFMNRGRNATDSTHKLSSLLEPFLQEATSTHLGFRMIGANTPRGQARFRQEDVKDYFVEVKLSEPTPEQRQDILMDYARGQNVDRPLFLPKQIGRIVDDAMREAPRLNNYSNPLAQGRVIIDEVFKRIENEIANDPARQAIFEDVKRGNAKIEDLGIDIINQPANTSVIDRVMMVLTGNTPINNMLPDRPWYNDSLGTIRQISQATAGFFDSVLPYIYQRITGGLQAIEPASLRPATWISMAGASGNGKTTLINTIAQLLGINVFRVNGSELKDGIGKITGEKSSILQDNTDVNTSSLAAELKQNPHTIIYLNEANLGDKVFKEALQMILDGQLKDSDGSLISFNRAIVFLDFNPHVGRSSILDSAHTTFWEYVLGRKDYPEGIVRELSAEEMSRARRIIIENLGEREALTGRMGQILLVGYLGRSHLHRIFEVSIKDWNEANASDNKSIEFSPEVKRILVDYGLLPFNREEGARFFTEDVLKELLDTARDIENFEPNGLWLRHDGGRSFLGGKVTYYFGIKDNLPLDQIRIESREDLMSVIDIRVHVEVDVNRIEQSIPGWLRANQRKILELDQNGVKSYLMELTPYDFSNFFRFHENVDVQPSLPLQ